jgi:hypothetical protein
MTLIFFTHYCTLPPKPELWARSFQTHVSTPDGALVKHINIEIYFFGICAFNILKI